MDPVPPSRRVFLRRTLPALAAAPVLGIARAAAPPHQVTETRIISPQPDLYHGWPTVCRRKNGELVLVWSGRRQAHVCPFGTVEMMLSRDEGATWTFPRTLLDSAIDDRDAGVLETARGTLLVTTFTSLAYEPQVQEGGSRASDPNWLAAHHRLPDDASRQADLGEWILRSTDGGATWSSRLPTGVNSPHGPIQLADGRLLYAGKRLWSAEKRIGVCVSSDDGLTWEWLAEIPTREGDRYADCHELHAVEAADGTILVQIRNHNPANKGETLQCESRDGGKTWTVPHPIGIWGLPSHLLRLRDGRLLMTYGHRRPPFGNQARLSTDHGATWSEPMILSGDGAGGDLGYPSTVELSGGDFLTVWYEKLASSSYAQLRQARWKLA
jgi:hypothetical protein